MYIYDFKFPDLSMIAYNHLLGHRSSYKEHPPQFFCTELRRSPAQSQMQSDQPEIPDRYSRCLRIRLCDDAEPEQNMGVTCKVA